MSYITIIIENQQHKTNLSSKSLASSVLDSVTAFYGVILRFESCTKNVYIASSGVRYSFTNADATGVDKKRGLVVG